MTDKYDDFWLEDEYGIGAAKALRKAYAESRELRDRIAELEAERAYLDHIINRLYDAVERKVKVAPTMGGSIQEDIHRGVMLTMDRVLKDFRERRARKDSDA